MTTAWLAGASGLVGGELLALLLADHEYTEVVSTGRRTLPVEHAKLVQAIVEFSDAASFGGLPAPHVAFSCLGTTLKKAGSPQGFRAIDMTPSSRSRRRRARRELGPSYTSRRSARRSALCSSTWP